MYRKTFRPVFSLSNNITNTTFIVSNTSEDESCVKQKNNSKRICKNHRVYFLNEETEALFFLEKLNLIKIKFTYLIVLLLKIKFH